MCTVARIQQFAIKHYVANPSVLPQLFSSLANRQLMTVETFLDAVERNPRLAGFVAEIAHHTKQ